jgi:hypothetical protein
MVSRWTDFLTTDGEKEWRKREEEFDNDIKTRKELLEIWEILIMSSLLVKKAI